MENWAWKVIIIRDSKWIYRKRICTSSLIFWTITWKVRTPGKRERKKPIEAYKTNAIAWVMGLMNVVSNTTFNPKLACICSFSNAGKPAKNRCLTFFNFARRWVCLSVCNFCAVKRETLESKGSSFKSLNQCSELDASFFPGLITEVA